MKYFFLILLMPFGKQALSCEQGKHLSEQDFLNLAKDLEVSELISTTEAINKSFPKHTSNNFTLVFDSKSAQRDGVSCEWPRIIRYSDDGKVVMSYTCNPKAPSYQQMETILFERKEQTQKFYHSNLEKVKDRTNINPTSCLGCHGEQTIGYSSARYNWGQYPNWDGVFGSHDDNIDGGGFDRKTPKSEVACFETFLKAQLSKGQENPCYAKLPWPEKHGVREYDANYRGSRNSNSLELKHRPNFRLSLALTRLQGQKLYNRIRANPLFHQLKYLLAMDAMFCFDRNEIVAFAKEMGISGPDNPRNILFFLSNTLGIAPSEWNLEVGDKRNSDYYHDGMGFTIYQFVSSKILSEIILSEYPEIVREGGFSTDRDLGKRVTEAYGDQYTCLDFLGMPLIFSKEMKKKKICEELKTSHSKMISEPRNEKEYSKDCYDDNTEGSLTEASKKLTDIEKGRLVIEQMCAGCHTKDHPDYVGFSIVGDENSLSQNQSKIMDAINSGHMPPGGKLDKKLIDYVQKFLHTKKEKEPKGD